MIYEEFESQRARYFGRQIDTKALMKTYLLVLSALIFGFTNSLRAQPAPILVESFTNTGCGPCKIPDQSLEQYVNSHQNVIVMNVHTNNPGKNDPFYLASQPSAYYRFYKFWNPQGNPWASVNGIASSTDWGTWHSQITSSDTAYSVHIAFLSGKFINGKSNLTIRLSGDSPQSVRLNVALLESGIKYNNTQAFGNPAGGEWNNILRTILPTPQGTPAFMFSGSKEFTVAIDTNGTGWNILNMQAVAFVEHYTQDSATEAKVVGLNSFDLAFSAVSPTHGIQASSVSTAIPNPFSSSTSLPIELKNPSKITVTIVNELGAETTLIRDREANAGTTSLPLDLHGFPTGMYQARVFVNGVFVGSQKLVRISE